MYQSRRHLSQMHTINELHAFLHGKRRRLFGEKKFWVNSREVAVPTPRPFNLPLHTVYDDNDDYLPCAVPQQNGPKPS